MKGNLYESIPAEVARAVEGREVALMSVFTVMGLCITRRARKGLIESREVSENCKSVTQEVKTGCTASWEGVSERRMGGLILKTTDSMKYP